MLPFLKCKFCFTSWVQYHSRANSHVFLAEFLLCPVNGSSDNTSEACRFLSTILFSQQFLQVRPSNRRDILPNRKLTLVASKLDVFMRHKLQFIPQIYQSFFCFALFLFWIPELSPHLLNPPVPCWQGLCLRFFQEGFSSTESFLYKFLSVWDGSLLRPQILDLLSDIPLMPSFCKYPNYFCYSQGSSKISLHLLV